MAGPIRINKASSEGIRTGLTWHVYYVVRRREEGGTGTGGEDKRSRREERKVIRAGKETGIM